MEATKNASPNQQRGLLRPWFAVVRGDHVERVEPDAGESNDNPNSVKPGLRSRLAGLWAEFLAAWDAALADPVERRRARDYPLSRWCLRPAAGAVAQLLAPTRVRPWAVTLTGVGLAGLAAVVLTFWPAFGPVAALLVLMAWFCDRLDGQLARRQRTVSALGAWLDANVDELVDLGLHLALAAAAAAWSESSLPWALLVGFFVGKYLLMYGLSSEASFGVPCAEPAPLDESALGRGLGTIAALRRLPVLGPWLRHLYHLPANADVRIHLLAFALLTGWWTAELAWICLYYNVRWLARYPLMAQRWKTVGGPGGAER